MKVITTFKVNYVVPETAEEKAELERTIAAVQREKLGKDFQRSDVKKVTPSTVLSGGKLKKPDSN